MEIGPVESENYFLLKETVKTRSHMVKMKVYIGKTYVKHCFVMKHHFRAPKSIRMVPSESENHFLLKETIKNRSRMVKMKPYRGFYRNFIEKLDFLKKSPKQFFFKLFGDVFRSIGRFWKGFRAN